MQIVQSRREFVASASMVAAASLLAPRRSLAGAPPEVTTIRLKKQSAISFAPLALTSQDGAEVTLASLRGTVVAVTFMAHRSAISGSYPTGLIR